MLYVVGLKVLICLLYTSKVSQGSAANLKPDLVMSALEQFTGAKLPEFVQYERLDMYCLENDKLVSLSEIGGNIE